MPRQNPQRTVFAEQWLRSQVAIERERRGWSYETLSSLMAQAGCPIAPSSLYKLEEGDPPRRVTVDELVAFARVFERTTAELLEDASRPAEQRAWALIERARDLDEREQALRRDEAALFLEMLSLLDLDPVRKALNPGDLSPNVAEALGTHMQSLARHGWPTRASRVMSHTELDTALRRMIQLARKDT